MSDVGWITLFRTSGLCLWGVGVAWGWMLTFLELADMWNATECLVIACAFYLTKKLGLETVLRALVLRRQKASSGWLLPRDRFQKEGVVEDLKTRPRSANTVNQLVGSCSNSWEMSVFPCVMYPRFHGESHTSQAWKTNHRNWSNCIIKRKVVENNIFSYQDLLETGNESIILLQLREHISNIFAQAGRTTFGAWRSAKTLVVLFISNRPGFLQRTSGPDCHTHSYVSCASPWHADFSYHDTSMATISGRECWPPEHFPERRSIRLPLCKLRRKFLHLIPVSFRSLFACRWRPTST